MEWFDKTVKKLKDFVSPPEYHRYLSQGYNHLSPGQIKHIIEATNKELARSREFGLVLRPEDEKKEKLALLSLFDHWERALIKMGQENSIAEQEVVLRGLIATIFKIMAPEAEYYHDYFSRQEKETGKLQTKNKYNCHLESVSSRLIQDFLDDKVPLTDK
ncbi:MAG: hypothetical protein V1867_00620 [Candidatus Falkowbacteria bacterium]